MKKPSLCVLEAALAALDKLARCSGDVKELELALWHWGQSLLRRLLGELMRWWQRRWLEQARDRYVADRWRSVGWVGLWGRMRLPVLVVRRRVDGKRLSLARVLFKPKATRLLSPGLEQLAVELACGQNFRPAARTLSRFCGVALSHQSVWQCVQYWGQRRSQQIARVGGPPPVGDVAHRSGPTQVGVSLTEMDGTYVRAQHRGCGPARGRAATPSRYFPVWMGLHYIGRVARYGPGARTRSVRLDSKHIHSSAEPLRYFGVQLRRQRDALWPRAACRINLSDGDEGLERQREAHFGDGIWLLDRWHVSARVRELCGPDQEEYRRLMQPLWRSRSEEALQALGSSPYAQRKPEAFQELFGYILGNREGIDAWHAIPAQLRRRGPQGQPAAVKSGSGAIEKNIEVWINRRFKRQGRSWNPRRAQHLLSLRHLVAAPGLWQAWWSKNCLRRSTFDAQQIHPLIKVSHPPQP